MSFVCFICKKTLEGSTRVLFAHLRNEHFICEQRGVVLKCGQGNCPRSYTTFNSLGKHLKSEHISCHIVNSSVSSSEIPDESETECYAQSNEKRIDEQALYSVQDYRRRIGLFIGNLYSSDSMTQSNVQVVVEHAADLIKDVVADVLVNVKRTLSCSGISLHDPAIHKMIEDIDSYSTLFAEVDTQYKREMYFKKYFGMVSPQPVFLGTRLDHVADSKTGSIRPVIRRETFQYVPILQLVSQLMNDSKVLEEIRSTRKFPKGFMHDFGDGALIKSIPLFCNNNLTLQVCLHFDECEMANPLGSRRGLHKLGFIYMSLRNISPKFNSKLSNIHIVAVFNSLDRVKYGFDAILKPIVRDLLQLEKGVDLQLSNGETITIHGTLVQVNGDNLGLNQLFGFVESFSANYFCRLCSVHKSDIQSKFVEDASSLRLKDSYCSQLQKVLNGLMLPSECGIKKGCLLNDLQFYHITNNGVVDPMHDLLEGIVPYETKLVLHNFIVIRKLLTLDELNSRIISFDYGYVDKKNKPTTLSDLELADNDKHSLNQKASQMHCLATIMPFLVGDRVPEGDEVWQLFLLLLEILHISFSEYITVGDAISLKHKIEEHHSHFKRIFHHKALLPKHHMLVHYPQIMMKTGPLTRCSSMRFEAKHNEAKRLCAVVCNFKDICRTVTRRHQITQCVRLAAGQCIDRAVQVTRSSTVVIQSLPYADQLLSAIPNMNCCDDINCADCVDICGTSYRKNMILVPSFNEDPQFCRIQNIIVMDDDTYFVCTDLVNESYSTHLLAYAVTDSDQVHILNYQDLLNFKPISVRRVHGKSMQFVASY